MIAVRMEPAASNDSREPIRVAKAPARPLLIWDGECGFCKLWVTRWRHHVAHAVDTAPYQDVESRFPEIPRGRFQNAVQLVLPSGEVVQAAHAVFRAFAEGGHPAVLRLYKAVPPLAAIVEVVYRWVAHHRVAASKLTRALWGRDPSPSTYRIARSLLVRGLGLVALGAFVSAWTQIDGLIGSRGIEPASTFLSTIGQMADAQGIGADRFRLVPTLFWLRPTDGALHGILAAGVVASSFLLFDWLAPIALVVAWASYLSIVTVGDVFFGYQWDALLLESLVAALFVARLRIPLKTRKYEPDGDVPSRVRGLIVPRALFFKLMLLSGIVKLASHDAVWSSGRALVYHFWTQPLPTRLAWYAQALPEGARHAFTYGALAIELFFPFLLVAPRRVRRLAFLGFALLQLSIAATGSYGFFNLLALVLSLPMLDDAAFRLAIPARWPRLRERFDRALPIVQLDNVANVEKFVAAKKAALAPAQVRWRIARQGATVIALVLTLTPMVRHSLPEGWTELTDYAAPFRSFNGYGLFAIMTTDRPEITIEASMDGVTWEPYVFRYKPGPLGRAPRFAGLHMPRLDWQMWFAALDGDCRGEHWYVRLLRRLFEGSPAVAGLFESTPFEGAAPKYIRSTLSQYRFTTPDERAASGGGALWAKEGEKMFCPTVHLDNENEHDETEKTP